MPTPTLLRPPLRLGYRLAFAARGLWWRLVPGASRAAAVALWGPDGLLVVRTSYRPGHDLPGGGCARGESARDAAWRELAEETGIAGAGLAVLASREFALRAGRQRIGLTVLEVRVGPDEPPQPEVDGVEVVWAGYLLPAVLAAAPQGPGLAAYLAAGGPTGPGA